MESAPVFPKPELKVPKPPATECSLALLQSPDHSSYDSDMISGTAIKRGAFIAFEGLDRAGKSTQCQDLVRNLEQRGFKVRLRRFPVRKTPIGKMIDDYLRGDREHEDHVIHLLFSANRWEAAEQIEADVAAGMVVIADRYYYSGCVYSAAKAVPGLDLTWARNPEVGLPRPDLVIFLNITPEAAAQRGDFGNERYEVREFQNRLGGLFGELFGTFERGNVAIVDASSDQLKVQQEILQAVVDRIQMVRNGELGSELRKVAP
ncbi:MAG: Thymidylate kinase [Caeruleum heppii]|nr:MAG: Thymidylate kinase [Caeruleum heppii]